MKKSWMLILVLTLVLLLSACKQSSTAIPLALTSTPRSTVPTATTTRVPPTLVPSPTPVVYVVQPGDSLSGIALSFEISVDEITQANGIQDANVIKVGQKLVIPGPTPIPTATVPPTPTPTPDLPPQLEIIDVVGRGALSAEMVIIANEGRGVALDQWTLRDAQGNVFLFPSIYVASGAEVRIHTGAGENTPQHLYWNRSAAAWEESGDTVILADERGVVHASISLD